MYSLETDDLAKLALSLVPSRATNFKDTRKFQSVETYNDEWRPLTISGYGARCLLNNLEDFVIEKVVVRSEGREYLSGTHRVA